MTDTNGYVAPEHLTTFTSIQVSKLIYPRLVSASVDFHRRGYTFSAAQPAGGYRPYDIQGAIQAAFDAKDWGAPYYLNSQSTSRPANAGHSRHGFGLAVDIITNAPTTIRDEILADHGFHLWSKYDPNHFEPDGIDVLIAPPESAFAALSSSALDTSIPQENDMKLIKHPNGQHGLTDGVLVFLQPDYNGTVVDLIPIWGQPIPVTANAWQFTADRVAENQARFTGGAQATAADLAKALAPLLDTVTEAELTAALATIKFPTKGTVELA